MSEPSGTAGPELDRIALLRDPPAPPGYVDPVADSDLLAGPPRPVPPSGEGTPEVDPTRGAP